MFFQVICAYVDFYLRLLDVTLLDIYREIYWWNLLLHGSLVHFSGTSITVEWYGFRYVVYLVHVFIYIFYCQWGLVIFIDAGKLLLPKLAGKRTQLNFKCSSLTSVVKASWVKASGSKSVVKASWVCPIILKFIQATSTYVHLVNRHNNG